MNPLDDLARGWKLPADNLPLVFAGHSVERFRERCRPGLPTDEVRRQLLRMLGSARVVAKPPEFVDGTQGATAYLVIADAVFPLFAHDGELRASTCLTPKDYGPVLREQRTSAKRAARRAARKPAWQPKTKRKAPGRRWTQGPGGK